MSADTRAPARAVTRAGPIALMRAGREAFRTVPGLRRLLVQGFVLLYGLFVVLGLVGWGLVYRYAIGPLAERLTASAPDPGILAAVLNFFVNLIVWLAQAMLLGATLIVAFLLALALLGEWFEVLAARIVRHRRGGEAAEGPFSLGALLRSAGRALRDSVVLLGLAVLALVVGFLPLVGPFLAIAIDSYLMGWEVREPYIAVRAEQGDDVKALRRGLNAWTAWAGLPLVLLAMIPWVGWLVLPAALIYMVAGVAWLSEGGGRGA